MSIDFRKLHAWRAADNAAQEASARLLHRRWVNWEREPKPTDAEIAHLECLRAESIRLYEEAMEELARFKRDLSPQLPGIKDEVSI